MARSIAEQRQARDSRRAKSCCAWKSPLQRHAISRDAPNIDGGLDAAATPAAAA